MTTKSIKSCILKSKIKQNLQANNTLQKLELNMDQKSIDTCVDHHRKLIDSGSLTESDCYNHVTTMVQYTNEETNKPVNKIFVCSSHGAKPKIKSFEVNV